MYSFTENVYLQSYSDQNVFFLLYLAYHFVGFQKKILDTLITIREQNKELCEQNKEILSLLKKNQENVGVLSFTLPELPVGLPLQSENDIHELESHLSSNNNLTRLVSIFSSNCGSTTSKKVL